MAAILVLRQALAPLPFRCAKIVSESHPFELLELLFERQQIPQFVVNIRIRRKAMEPLEATTLPGKQVRDALPTPCEMTAGCLPKTDKQFNISQYFDALLATILENRPVMEMPVEGAEHMHTPVQRCF